jgi:hypothetical protein
MRPFYLSQADEKRLARYPLGSQDGKEQKLIVLKLYNDTYDWYIVEAERIDERHWRMYGYRRHKELNKGRWMVIILDGLKGRLGEDKQVDDVAKCCTSYIWKTANFNKYIKHKIDCNTNTIVMC